MTTSKSKRPPFPSLFLLLFLLPLASPIIHRSERIVKSRYGDLQGFLVKPNHRALGMVEVFLGVPYAAAPIASFRFMPPMQPFTWSYVRRAEVMPPVCPQNLPDVSKRREALKRMPEGRYNYLERLIPLLRNQSEDCLFLNIYVPVRGPAATGQVPVIAYIHGESYEWNSGNPYDGVTLASYGQVIVVTINFRLGVFGFLRPALSESHVSNFGLLDQIAALHWIKENIAAFGGDPNQITILGHGTGAALANMLLISPVSQVSNGLFQRAILMSGSAISKWALTWDPYKYTIQVAKAVGCPLNDRGEELVRCLRSKTVDELLSVNLQTPPFTTPLGPIVDGMIIKADPLRTMASDASAYGRYDLLYGVTLAESYAMLNAAEVKLGMTSERKNRLLRAYVSNNFKHHASHIYSAILNEYNTYSSARLPDERSIRDQTLQILSDAQIVAPVVNMGNLHSDLNSKSYFYVFNHQTEYGDYPVSQGTVHGEELAYVFGAPLVGGFNHFTLNYTLEEVFLSELVMTLWTNFAKTGNPNLPTPQEFLTPGSSPNWGDNMRTMWPPYEKTTQQYLHLDMQVVKNSHYRARKLALWNRLIPDLVSSSGNIRDPIAPNTFPGATLPTITLVPTESPLLNVLFEADRTTTNRPNYFPIGPKPIKPVQSIRDKPTPMPIYPIPDDKKKEEPLSAEESTPVEEASILQSSNTLYIIIHVVVLVLNFIFVYLICFWARRCRRKRKEKKEKERESETADVSESPSADLQNNETSMEDKDSERRSRRKRRGPDKDSQDSISEPVSRVSSLSRESSGRRKHSQSQERSLSSVHDEAKLEKPIVNGHKRSKSDHSMYVDIGKEESKALASKETKQSRRPSVKFNTLADFPNKALNRSMTSLASKSSIKSTSSRASGKSVTSKTSAKNGSSAKEVKKNASCQSLPNSEYSWAKPNEAIVVASALECANDVEGKEKQQTIATMQKRNYPKVLPDAPEIHTCSTLPRVRPPPPPRSTSLTARDIQELEKLQEVYRKTRPPRHASTDSCELSGSEPFYSMGGGEAPAKAPGMMYGPTLAPAAAARISAVLRKGDGPDYDQYQKYTPSYQLRDPTTGETQIQLTPPKSYIPYGDNRAPPRGPLAAFGKINDRSISPVDYEVSRLSSVSPISTIPPPVPAHQVPLTPSILKTPAPMTFPQNPVPMDLKIKPILTSSAAMFDQTENTGTIKRQKAKTSSNAAGSGSDTLEKPLKSALKTTSAYDKPKGGSGGGAGTSNSGADHSGGSIPHSSRAGAAASPPVLVPTSPQSLSSVSSTSPSLSSAGSGLPSPTELKSILVKRTPRTSQSPGTGPSKQRPPEDTASR